MINGETILIAHVGYPTTTFKAPMQICNPYFEKMGLNAVVAADGREGRRIYQRHIGASSG